MLTLADLELQFLRAVKGATGATLQDCRVQIYGTEEHPYFASLSGLVPAQRWSLSDHKLTYYRTQTGLTGTVSDTSKAFWEAQIAGGSSALYPELTLYPSLTLYPQGA